MRYERGWRFAETGERLPVAPHCRGTADRPSPKNTYNRPTPTRPSLPRQQHGPADIDALSASRGGSSCQRRHCVKLHPRSVAFFRRARDQDFRCHSTTCSPICDEAVSEWDKLQEDLGEVCHLGEVDDAKAAGRYVCGRTRTSRWSGCGL